MTTLLTIISLLSVTITSDSLEVLSNDNPSLHSEDVSSEISAAYTSAPASAERIAQMGTGGRMITIEAKSFQQITSADNVWGKARYTNRCTYDVRWNEVSDFLLVYPYVLGDPRGGDMKGEQYELSGGYNRQIIRATTWRYGIELGYRALNEYRERDPRPNNTTAHIFGSLGGNAEMGKWSFGAAVSAGKYKQTSDLIYMNELGAQMEYQLTGIGTEYNRFSGANNNTFYKGYNYGFQADVAYQPYSLDKLYASVKIDKLNFEKIITDLNRMPLNRLKITDMKAEIAWKHDDRYMIKARYDGCRRRGHDNIFGDATSNVYPQIGSRKQFEGSAYCWSVTALYRLPHNLKRFVLTLKPIIALAGFENKHRGTGNSMNADNFCYGLTTEGKALVGKTTLEGGVTFSRRQSTNHGIQLHSAAIADLAETLRRTDQYFADGETTIGCRLKLNKKINSKTDIYFETSWLHTLFYDSNHANIYEARIGLTI